MTSIKLSSIIIIFTVLGLIKDGYTSSEVLERLKRANVNAYAYGALNSCANVGSAGVYCSVNYPVPDSIKTDADENALTAQTLVNYIKNSPQFKASDTCVNDVRKIICSILFPQCNPQRKEIIFDTGDCINSFNNCPTSVKNVLKNYVNCDLIPKGAFNLNDCIKPPSFNLKNCPKAASNVLIPKYLTMDPLIVDTSIPSLKSFMQSQGNDNRCIQRLIDFLCADIPFCSQDKTKLLTTATVQGCQSLFTCLQPATQAALRTNLRCNLFPNSTVSKAYNIPVNTAYVTPNAAITGKAFSNSPNQLVMTALVALWMLVINLLTKS